MTHPLRTAVTSSEANSSVALSLNRVPVMIFVSLSDLFSASEICSNCIRPASTCSLIQLIAIRKCLQRFALEVISLERAITAPLSSKTITGSLIGRWSSLHNSITKMMSYAGSPGSTRSRGENSQKEERKNQRKEKLPPGMEFTPHSRLTEWCSRYSKNCRETERNRKSFPSLEGMWSPSYAHLLDLGWKWLALALLWLLTGQ